MASPRKLIPKISQVSPRFLQPPDISGQWNVPVVTRKTTLNLDTPNRSRIVSHGLSNSKLKVIGVGGFGTVYRASYKDVAAKVLKHNNNNDEIYKAEMHTRNLKHKNIVRIIGCDQGDALSVIIMELCGPSLEDIIEERILLKKERISFLIDVGKALSYCHSVNIVHADVKPKNIFITEKNVAKLGDFGSSVICNEIDQNKFCAKGTPGYEAPETIKGKVPTPMSDIYSLGVVAWQMLSRRKPFGSYHYHVILYMTGKGCKPEQNDSLDDELKGKYKKLYRKMWSTNEEDRPPLKLILEKLKNFLKI